VTRSELRRTARLITPAFALHVLEEAPGFTHWVNRYASERYTQRDFVRNNALGLAGTAGATALVTRSSSRPLFLGFYTVVVTQEALWNTVFHGVMAGRHRAYSPGLATALMLFLPLWWRVTRLAVREGLLTRRGVALAALAAGALHALVVARQVFFVELRPGAPAGG
jgi:hypothetical protein